LFAKFPPNDLRAKAIHSTRRKPAQPKETSLINVIASISTKIGKRSDYLQILKAGVPAVNKPIYLFPCYHNIIPAQSLLCNEWGK
jgi:hypothetical protein